MVNFVRHIRAVMYKLEADSRIEVYHVSLYWALFQTWNEHRFQNPMRIYRDEIMARAKIRTRTVYAKCMRELAAWGYFTYDPSTRRFEPCLVAMRRFDGAPHTRVETSWYPLEPVAEAGNEPATGPENGTTAGTTSATRTRTPSGTTTRTDGRTQYINSINDPTIQNDVNADEQAHPLSDFGNDLTPPAETPGGEEKSNVRGAGGGAGAEAIPASLDHVYPFFAILRSTRVEAEKFFHYFTSNGWKVGGRSPMRDWRAAARNWVLNAVRFQAHNGPTPGSLASPGPQNHAEPL
ncbi:hypothetical protein [Dawidia soli]|uniref:Uncharacterized protein n=1 Tax=Dawidia soli TaxID=2782352 RepID=A0AAP2GJ94_9BACT|nr:hypothetical protein [Dawidia soli]MBT1689166.1 hypothetical protein [Dawidia soli]